MEDKNWVQPFPENIYQKAWQRLLKEVEYKTGWGKVEIKNLMLDCLINPDKKQ